MVSVDNYEHLTESELGSRPAKGTCMHSVVCMIAFAWAVFQIWISSPLQFQFDQLIGSHILTPNDFQFRAIHLTFGFLLAFLTFPAFARSSRSDIPIWDWVMCLLGVVSTLYIVACYSELAMRVGMPTTMDLLIAAIGFIVLLEAARRSVGTAIAIVAVIFLFYSRCGEIMPEMIIHKDYLFSAIASHQWFSTEGVFGTAIAVSTDFVFLYVLFGGLLEKTGAGNFFIDISFALLKRFRGGPAKAAVISSGLMGMISGSSIANTITVGSLTIPMMKKMGFTAEKAAAIEVSAGINGQIMPPVMGAAAFLMAEYLSIPYIEVVKHAFLPAVLIYGALLYIVHIESHKLSVAFDESPNTGVGIKHILLSALTAVALLLVVLSGLYILLEGFSSFVGIKALSGRYALYVVGLLCCSAYIGLLCYQHFLSQRSNVDKSSVSFKLKSGLHHFLPLGILVWCLLVEHLSPSRSAYWTILFLFFELITKELVLSFLTGEWNVKKHIQSGLIKCYEAMVMSSKNMTVVAIATATAGVIVGSVSLTGVGLKLAGVLDYLSSGSLLLTLFLTALMCIVLGMGMPTTACYIVVSTLMVPVLAYVTSKNGVMIPLFAMHLFVFYFGLMADVTPPVGLASYAAAAIAGGNAIYTGIQAFLYNMRTMLLPFLFVLNPEILLFGIDGLWQLVVVVFSSAIGLFVLTAASQNYFLKKSKIHESFILLFAGLALMIPGSLLELVSPEFKEVMPMSKELLSYHNESQKMQLVIEETNFFGQVERRKFTITNSKADLVTRQLNACGISTKYNVRDNVVDIDSVSSKSGDACRSLDTANKISRILFSQTRLSIGLIRIFGVLLVSLVVFMQRRR